MRKRKHSNRTQGKSVPPHQLDQTYRMLDLISTPLDDLDHLVLADGRGVQMLEVAGHMSFSQLINLMDEQECRA